MGENHVSILIVFQQFHNSQRVTKVFLNFLVTIVGTILIENILNKKKAISYLKNALFKTEFLNHANQNI